jgi:hypothetical protein
MRIPAICIVISLAITTSGLVPSTVAAAEPTAGVPALPAYADVRVDPGMDDVEYTRSWGAIGIGRGLAMAPIDAALLGARRLTVDLAGAFGGYRIVVGLAEGGEWTGDVQDRKCACDDEELINAIAEMVATLAKGLRDTARGAENRPVTDAPPRSSDDRRAPLTEVGKAGIGVTVGGLAVAGLGVGFLIRGRQLNADATDEARVGRNFTLPGALALVGGVVLLGVGLALVGIDRAKARRTRVAAWWTPGRGGVALTGRF